MSTITVKDGTTVYYKDWGEGPVVTFSHGWPLNSDAWDGQMLFLAQNGFRVVAHDRRGHGRSSAGTRVALGTGIGMLISRGLSKDAMKAAGLALTVVRGLTTIPLAISIIGKENLKRPEIRSVA
jgi:pimeloyl-ACP methyl ester carboxylesterase